MKNPAMDIIKKLQNLDLNDLKNIDLKTINYEKILNFFKAHLDKTIVAASVLATLFFSFQYFIKKHAEITTVSNQITQLEKKIAAIKEYDAVDKKTNDFLNLIPPPVSDEDFMNKLTDFADKRNIQIKSFAPTKRQAMKLYDASSLNLNVTTHDYKNLWLFIHDIETSPLNIRIDDLNCRLGTGGENRRSQPEIPMGNENKSPIDVQLEISLINFKKDKHDAGQ